MSTVTIYTDGACRGNPGPGGWGINEWLPNWKARGWKTSNRKPVKNEDLWRELDRVVAQHEIDWRWVRGHSGVPGNERADELANEAVDAMLNGA